LHEFPWQLFPQQHWPLPLHERKQSLLAALHWKGAQSVTPLSRQVPRPSQVRGFTRSLPLQLAAAHWVPAGWKRHEPAPSQVPSRPQDAAGVDAHEGWVDPAGTGWQKPIEPDSLQLRQGPQLSDSQQTPSAHWPLLHWPSLVQATPRPARGPVWPHTPARQVAGGTQSASLPQPAKQALPLHR
jgi:hypothetical protein